MILAIDVGNTNIALGLYKENTLSQYWRITTDRRKTEDEYGFMIHSLLEHKKILPDQVKGIIISSVVPPIMFALEKMCEKYFHIKPKIVGPGMKTGLNIRYDSPRDVGADRIANAVAALSQFDGPLVIVDFGTATTFCYIDQHNQYIGGAIAPGMTVSTDALYDQASKLPRVELTKPDDVVGKNTVLAMQAGIYYGYVGQVDGIVERMKKQADTPPTVIATGGLAHLIQSESKTIDIVDPYLTIKGLKVIYDKNANV